MKFRLKLFFNTAKHINISILDFKHKLKKEAETKSRLGDFFIYFMGLDTALFYPSRAFFLYFILSVCPVGFPGCSQRVSRFADLLSNQHEF